MKKLVALLPLALFVAFGCSGSETQVTKDQEANFRNPPKEIPADVAERMRKSREEGAKIQAERMKAAQEAAQSQPQAPGRAGR